MASRFYLEYEGILDGNWEKTIWDVYDSKHNDMIIGQLIAKDGLIIDVLYESETNEE